MKNIHTKAAGILLILGILFMAANLRPAITAVGPLIGTIRTDLDLSNSLAGLLTTLPLIAFAVLSPLVPKIGRHFGIERALWLGLLVLLIGIVVRSLPFSLTLFVGTTFIGLAIAICNVLLPGYIKKKFSHKVGLMTGVYSTSMVAWAALGSGTSVPLMQTFHFGWRGALACWAALAVIALAVWLPQLRSRPQRPMPGATKASIFRLWSSPLAWQVTLFMGSQSLLFYVLVAWLPDILHDRGMHISTAGWMVSLMQFTSLPTTFVVPMLADRFPNQRSIVTSIGIVYMIGIGGILTDSGLWLVPVWIVLIGISQGATISLSLTFLGLRAANTQQAAELSGMAQSMGYLLAASGPLLFGLLRDWTHSWTISLLCLLFTGAMMLVAGLGAGRPLHVMPDIDRSEASGT